MSETFRAKVKPLEFKMGYAPSIFGRYATWRAETEGRWYFVLPQSERGITVETEADALFACQRDHEARVRALLILEEE